MSGPFKLKYNNSAFPFRSPLLDNGKKKGEGFMHPPYKKPVGPTEKPHYVHGYKNFESILTKLNKNKVDNTKK